MSSTSSLPTIGNVRSLGNFCPPSTSFMTPKPAPQFDISKFNREMKGVRIKIEYYPAVTSLCDDIQQALIAGIQDQAII